MSALLCGLQGRESASAAVLGEDFIKEQDNWALIDRWDWVEEERVEGISITGSTLSEGTEVEMTLAWHK